MDYESSWRERLAQAFFFRFTRFNLELAANSASAATAAILPLKRQK
jgi:hypothetical protein